MGARIQLQLRVLWGGPETVRGVGSMGCGRVYLLGAVSRSWRRSWYDRLACLLRMASGRSVLAMLRSGGYMCLSRRRLRACRVPGHSAR